MHRILNEVQLCLSILANHVCNIICCDTVSIDGDVNISDYLFNWDEIALRSLHESKPAR